MEVHIGQLYALVKSEKPIEAGDTLSHRYMDDLKAAGFAIRSEEGWVLTNSGRLFWNQLMCRTLDVEQTWIIKLDN